jgi:RimJ/RimL family protein N-acetyltransferase
VRLSDGVVCLRAWRPEDADAIRSAAADPAIARWSTIGDGVEAWLAVQDRPGVTSLAMTADGDDLPRGRVHLRHADGEIGYWVLPEHRGRGLAARAVALLAAHGREQLGLRTLRMEIEPGNEASLRVAAAAGAQPTGERVTESDRQGVPRELLRFRL